MIFIEISTKRDDICVYSYSDRVHVFLQGLTEKFKEKDTPYVGSATFTYEAFMLAVLPFIIA